MERLTAEQVELMAHHLPSAAKTSEAMHQVFEELYRYKKIEEELGCPLEVRCRLYDGAIIYDKNGRKMIVRDLGEHDFLAYQIKEPFADLMYIKGYKKTWWLKADRTE